jgi:hypothetical protein
MNCNSTMLNRIFTREKKNCIITKDRDGDSALQPCKPPEIHTSILHLRTINMPVHTKITVKPHNRKRVKKKMQAQLDDEQAFVHALE